MRGPFVLPALLVVTLVWGGLYVARTSFVFEGERVFCLWDDAMISMHYARNLAGGEGLVWMPGDERVQGISNLGVSVLMAGLHLLPLSEAKVSLAFQLLNLAVLVACVALAWALARRLEPERPEVALAAALATALCAPLALWSLLGSDMGLVAVWLLAGTWALSRAESAGSVPPALLAALAPGLALRPDALLFYAALLAAAWPLPGGRRASLLGVGAGALVLAAWGLVGLLYYGDALPNTYYLKATGAPRSLVLSAGFEQLREWLPRLAAPLALAALGAWRHRRRVTARVGAASIVAALAYSIWVGGDWADEYGIRFAVPALPPLLVLAAAGAAALVAALPSPRLRATAVPGLLVLVVLFLGPVEARDEWLDPRGTPRHAAINRTNFLLARYLERRTDPSTTIGVYWAGTIPYFSRRPAVDLLGKSDRHIARLPIVRFQPGHSKWDWEYVVNERRPDLIRGTSRGLGLREDFRSAYVKVVKRPGHDFYMRRDSLAKLRDPKVEFVEFDGP